MNAVLQKRFGKYGLTLHPDKTKLVDFRKPSGGKKKGNTFDFLGFTHYWGKSRRGNMVVKRKTAKTRLVKAVRKVYEWCKHNRHESVKSQYATLRRNILGHYNFFGVTSNSRALHHYFDMVKRAWRKWLNRRSRENDMPWDKFNRLLKRYSLPEPRIVYSYV